jgi:hypothetical protein
MSDIGTEAQPAPVLWLPREFLQAASRGHDQVNQPLGWGCVSPDAIPMPPPIPESHSP